MNASLGLSAANVVNMNVLLNGKPLTIQRCLRDLSDEELQGEMDQYFWFVPRGCRDEYGEKYRFEGDEAEYALLVEEFGRRFKLRQQRLKRAA